MPPPPAPVPLVPPPPVALVPPVVGPAGVPVLGAGVAPPAALVPPVPADGVTSELEDEESADDEEDEAEAVSVAGAEVVEVVELDWVEMAGNEALACPVVGTVSGGAPEVSALDGVELPPQAASPRAARMPKSSAANVAIERLMGGLREDDD